MPTCLEVATGVLCHVSLWHDFTLHVAMPVCVCMTSHAARLLDAASATATCAASAAAALLLQLHAAIATIMRCRLLPLPRPRR